MTKPTQQDAQIMLQLASWHTASGVGEAMNWVRSDHYVKQFKGFNKKYPHGTDGRLKLLTVLGFYETVGTIWKNGLISEELLFDWLWVTGAWDAVKGVALGMRAEAGVEALWENFEALSNRQRGTSATPAAVKKTPARRSPAKKAQ